MEDEKRLETLAARARSVFDRAFARTQYNAKTAQSTESIEILKQEISKELALMEASTIRTVETRLSGAINAMMLENVELRARLAEYAEPPLALSWRKKLLAVSAPTPIERALQDLVDAIDLA